MVGKGTRGGTGRQVGPGSEAASVCGGAQTTGQQHNLDVQSLHSVKFYTVVFRLYSIIIV